MMITEDSFSGLHIARRPQAMKSLLSTLVLAAIAVAGTARAADVSSNGEIGTTPTQKGSTVNSVTFGENSKLTVLPSERDRIRSFYRDVLGCPMTKKSDRADFFKIGNTFYLGVIYDDAAQSPKDRFQSIWLELRTDHPEELKQKILQFGIAEIEYWDKEHFYFQAPGGQVFRLSGTTEDMSKWQR
jgi:catechol 2,3-dioxygenase-like lactoylglutathione lyase family enzyme